VLTVIARYGTVRYVTDIDHVQLVEALSDPAIYPHPVEGIQFIQTHISSVFLTGEYVYKLKKPVNFGFLDFSTIALRKLYCNAEVELNSRLAPSVYLRAAPLTVADGKLTLEGEGEIVDWVVIMRELDQRLLGTEVMKRGELTEAHMDSLVDVLVPFYQEAKTGEGVDQYGTVEAVKFNTDENFGQTKACSG
jgi:aminoglycoside phosphotransferase family enzyme